MMVNQVELINPAQPALQLFLRPSSVEDVNNMVPSLEWEQTLKKWRRIGNPGQAQ